MSQKILIVDDEFNFRTLLAQLLQDEGYSITTAENGETALKALECELFNVILTDIGMPHTDGVKLFSKVRELHPHIPIILFTTYETIEAAVKALKEGAFHYLEKPVNVNLLKHTVKQALDIQMLEEEITRLRKQLEEKKSDQP